jgi:hypothetical protein
MPSDHIDEFQIHTEQGKKDLIEKLKSHLGPNTEIIWGILCNMPAVKNTRPSLTDGTLTERTLRVTAEGLTYKNKNVHFSHGYLQITTYGAHGKGNNSIYAFNNITLSLSNPNYIPVYAPDYFLVKDNKKCSAFLIYENGERITEAKSLAIRFSDPQIIPQTWFLRVLNEFFLTFG